MGLLIMYLMQNNSSLFYNFKYIISRILTVTFKPLLLFTISNFLSINEVSVKISICFLLVPLSQVLVSFDPHRNYYISYIKNEYLNCPREFKTYCINFFLLALFSLLFSYILLYYFLNINFIFVFITLLYLMTEKLIDEILRFLMFEKNFQKWSSINITRVIISILAIFFVFILNEQISAEKIVMIIAISNCFAFIPFLYKIKIIIFKVLKGISSYDLLLAFYKLKNNTYIWISSLLAISITYSDRLFILVINTEKLPSISLAVTCFSLIQIGVEFFYISNFRRDFLENKMTTTNTIFSLQFLSIFLSFTFLSCFIYFFVNYFSLFNNRLNFYIIFSILITQMSISINSISQQILYWRTEYYKLIKSDVIFWILFICMLLFCSIYFNINLAYILISLIFIIRTLINLHHSN